MGLIELLILLLILGWVLSWHPWSSPGPYGSWIHMLLVLVVVLVLLRAIGIL